MPAQGSILLGEVARHLASVNITCNFCPRRGKASIARLLQEHGPDMPDPVDPPHAVSLLAEAPGCPDRRAVRRAPAGVVGRVRAEAGGVMIVTTRPPRRNRPKAAQPVEIIITRIVQHVPRRRLAPKSLEPDSPADARVRAFFLRMGLKLPEA